MCTVFLAALLASCFLGALDPQTLRAVCLVLAIVFDLKYLELNPFKAVFDIFSDAQNIFSSLQENILFPRIMIHISWIRTKTNYF